MGGEPRLHAMLSQNQKFPRNRILVSQQMLLTGSIVESIARGHRVQDPEQRRNMGVRC